jgi:hypothetical protein
LRASRETASIFTKRRRGSRERRVLCLDYRGRGRSDYDRDWRHYEPRTYLNDICHLLAATGTGRAVVIGTSMGGLLAMFSSFQIGAHLGSARNSKMEWFWLAASMNGRRKVDEDSGWRSLSLSTSHRPDF